MFSLVHVSPGMKILTSGPLLVSTHWHDVTAAQMQTITRHCADHVKRVPMMSSLTILRGSIAMKLDPAVRTASAELTKLTEGHALGQAVVVEADGFKASVVRSVLAGVNLMALRKSPQQVFKDVREGLAWVCALEGQPPDVRNAEARLWGALEPILVEDGRSH